MKRIWVILLIIIISKLNAIQRTVLLEGFASTSCQYCGSAIRGLEDMLLNHRDSVIIIVYYPGTTDFFYRPEAYERFRNYYNLSGVPVVILDGILSVPGALDTGSMYPYYKQQFDLRKHVDQPVSFEFSGSYDPQGRTGNLNVTVINHSANGINGYLRTAIVLVDTPYSWQDMDHLVYVMRKMVPDPKGIKVNLQGYGETNVEISFVISPNDDERKTAFVIFLQDDSTKEVIGAKKEIMLDSLNWVSVVERENKLKELHIESGRGFFLVQYYGDFESTLILYDVKGGEVLKEKIIVGENRFVLKPGVYFYRFQEVFGKLLVY